MEAGYRSKYEMMEELADGIGKLLEDLCQSGFDTVHDSTLGELGKAAELTAQCGMERLSEMLGQLAGELSARRHRTEEMSSAGESGGAGGRGTAWAAEIYTSLNEYLYLAGQKAAYDRGLEYYTQTDASGLERVE